MRQRLLGDARVDPDPRGFDGWSALHLAAGAGHLAVVERLLVLHFGRVIGIGAPAEIMASREVQEIYLGVEI